MGTPFITHLEPTRLIDGYDATKPREQQPSHVPKPFLDAMEVRTAVFVKEQNVPAEYEYDADDPRSCHWVTYASVNQTKEPEERDPSTGDVIRPRKSETISMPIGTLRIVPFPHPPHPPPGARYVNNVLVEDEASALPFGVDRPTKYHDGKEPYVKLGRVAVIPEFRGHHIGTQLWRVARRWLEDNPAFFNPSITELGMDQLKAGTPSDVPKWKGLVCCHAQERYLSVYKKWGFKVDEGMGKWYEEGILHVGMFQRLHIKEVNPSV
ncbi:hypothetical protein M426DRAFT_59176 [Hypoxylon sp. CI-4A]|nr:hypothetical protein M426DRAFT_59176 [Hypoxylon sp. CI-4A]